MFKSIGSMYVVKARDASGFDAGERRDSARGMPAWALAAAPSRTPRADAAAIGR
ncbi:hypothetical protein [Siculibacillus lacustris]|uniref:hypothetical protein n=1 Tax=Siculibacillus lacustris TaxID=1549641 RepID=UPI0013F1460C|nr:hypothetical protein [Siculibacillus lacustris]